MEPLQLSLERNARRREYLLRNREKTLEARRKYRLKNLAKERARAIKWSANNPEKVLLWNARRRAKKSGLAFSITLADISIPKVCPYLGLPLSHGGVVSRNSASLDRKDNRFGYVPGNVEVISYSANRIKNDASPSELVLFAKEILRRHG